MLTRLWVIWGACIGPGSNSIWAGMSIHLGHEGPEGLLICPRQDFCRYRTGVEFGCAPCNFSKDGQYLRRYSLMICY